MSSNPGLSRDEKRAQAFVSLLFRIGDGYHVRELGTVGVGDEPLLAVEDVVAFAVFHRGGVDVGAGSAGAFGQGAVGEDALVLELGHVFGLELLAAVIVEDAPVQVGCIVQMHAHAARSARELFLDLQDFLFAEAPAAVLLGQRVAIEVVLACELEEFFGKLVRDLDFFLHFLEGPLGEGAYLLEVVFEFFFRQLAHKSSFSACSGHCRPPISPYRNQSNSAKPLMQSFKQILIFVQTSNSFPKTRVYFIVLHFLKEVI